MKKRLNFLMWAVILSTFRIHIMGIPVLPHIIGMLFCREATRDYCAAFGEDSPGQGWRKAAVRLASVMVVLSALSLAADITAGILPVPFVLTAQLAALSILAEMLWGLVIFTLLKLPWPHENTGVSFYLYGGAMTAGLVLCQYRSVTGDTSAETMQALLLIFARILLIAVISRTEAEEK